MKTSGTFTGYLIFHRVRPAHDGRPASRTVLRHYVGPDFYKRRQYHDGTPVRGDDRVTAPDGTEFRVWQGTPIYARPSARAFCNSLCTLATGPDCDCSCAGKNHSIDWRDPHAFDPQMYEGDHPITQLALI